MPYQLIGWISYIESISVTVILDKSGVNFRKNIKNRFWIRERDSAWQDGNSRTCDFWTRIKFHKKIWSTMGPRWLYIAMHLYTLVLNNDMYMSSYFHNIHIFHIFWVAFLWRCPGSCCSTLPKKKVSDYSKAPCQPDPWAAVHPKQWAAVAIA